MDFGMDGNGSNQRVVVPAGGTIANFVLTTGKPWAGTREQVSANFQNEPLLRGQFNSGCMLPLPGRNGILGTLALLRTKHDPQSEDERVFFTAVCCQIALVLQHALAWREVSELKDKLDQEKLYLEEEIR